MRKLLLSLSVVFLTIAGQSQSWKFMRHEFGLGVGATNFLGELGGANAVGTHLVNDFEFSMTRPTVQIDYRFTINPSFHLKFYGGYGILKGNDNTTTETFRHNRNLNFKTNIFEVALHFEYFPFGEHTGHIYKMRGTTGKKYNYLSPYLFFGVGGYHFNPKGQYTDGSWHELKPLQTEGQGMAGGPAPYSLYQLSVPYGVGIKYSITKQWNIGFELSNRLTFTDYIDDVSGVYYDNTAIQNANGSLSAYFADPNLGEIPVWTDGQYVYDVTATGQQRGDPTHNDSFMFAVFSLNFKLLYGRFNLPKF